MFTALRIALLGSLIFVPDAFAQAHPHATPGVISGRAFIEGSPAPAVTIMCRRLENADDSRPPFRTVTDAEGRYQMADLPAGQYQVQAFAPACVFVKPVTVNLDEGGRARNVDISLIRGGVITGRITDAEGRAAFREHIQLTKINERGQRENFTLPGYCDEETDDRGVYRIYGLPTGRYRVAAGSGSKSGGWAPGSKRVVWERTFYPDVTDEAQAALIEVAPGKEVTGIDIRLRNALKTYIAQGRVLDVRTRQSLVGVKILYGLVNSQAMQMGPGSVTTNAQGEFIIPALLPGKYAAYALTTSAAEAYSDTARFEVSEDDVGGIEINLQPAVAVSGEAVLEIRDPAIVARLSQVRLFAYTIPQGFSAPSSGRATVGPDGSFRFTGLRPGRVAIRLVESASPRGFWVVRIEHNGRSQPDGIEVGTGENVTGVRVVLSYGGAVLRGKVQVTGGSLPTSTRMVVQAIRTGANGELLDNFRQTDVDVSGQFTIQGLSAGEYEVRLRTSLERIPPVSQRVTVTDGGVPPVTLILDLRAVNRAGEKQ